MDDKRMLTLGEMSGLLKDRNLTAIEKRIGISRITLSKIRNKTERLLIHKHYKQSATI